MKIANALSRLKRFNLWYQFKFPHVLTFAAVSVLAVKALTDFLFRKVFEPTPYLTIIGLSMALASVSFGYARLKIGKEQDTLVAAGEGFVHAGFCVITAVLIGWIVAEVTHDLSGLGFYKYVSWLFICIFSLGQASLARAAILFHTAFLDLEEHLSEKTKN